MYLPTGVWGLIPYKDIWPPSVKKIILAGANSPQGETKTTTKKEIWEERRTTILFLVNSYQNRMTWKIFKEC